MPLGTEVVLGPGHIVLVWASPSPPKGAQPLPNFRPMPVVAKWLDGSSCHLVLNGDAAPSPKGGQSRRLCVRWGPRPPSPKRGQSPKFSAHVYCGQTDGWMKLVLGIEVGLSLGDFVLDGDPVPFPQKGVEPLSPIFGPFLLWPNGSMHQDATWYGCWP